MHSRERVPVPDHPERAHRTLDQDSWALAQRGRSGYGRSYRYMKRRRVSEPASARQLLRELPEHRLAAEPQPPILGRCAAAYARGSYSFQQLASGSCSQLAPARKRTARAAASPLLATLPPSAADATAAVSGTDRVSSDSPIIAPAATVQPSTLASTCASTELEPTRVTPTVWLMIDGSGSTLQTASSAELKVAFPCQDVTLF